VQAWGQRSDFTCALQLVAFGHPAVATTADRLCTWASDKLATL
jgi:hypothetical protein